MKIVRKQSVKSPRQQAIERLDAMAGRDAGGIMPPRDIVLIDRSKNPWWKNQYES